MKKIIPLLFASAVSVFGSAGDVVFKQINPAGTALTDRVITLPSPAAYTVYGMGISPLYPSQFKLGTGFVVTGTYPNYTLALSGGAGLGTVTSVSVVTANGVSGSVANASTNPAITLTLGAITPSSVAASGTVTGSNLSGTNTGDQTLNSLLPSQGGNSGKVLGTDGTNASWVTGGGGGSGNVSSSGTPTAGQAAEWTDATTIQGVSTTGSGNYVKSTSPALITPALGTPSSGVVTNLTGTASININGTVGATTPSTGAFTLSTIGAASAITGPRFIINDYPVVGAQMNAWGANPSFQFRRANGTPGSESAVLNGDTILNIGGGGWDGSGSMTGRRGGITVVATENWSTTAHGAITTLTATPNGSITPATALTVTSTGLNSTAIGATTPSTGAFTTVSTTGAISVANTTNGILFTGGSARVGGDATNTWLRLANNSGAILFQDTSNGQVGAINTTGYQGAIGATTPSTGQFTRVGIGGAPDSTRPLKIIGVDGAVGSPPSYGAKAGIIYENNNSASVSIASSSGGYPELNFYRSGTGSPVANWYSEPGTNTFIGAVQSVEAFKLTTTGINSTAIGATTPSTGAFSYLTLTGADDADIFQINETGVGVKWTLRRTASEELKFYSVGAAADRFTLSSTGINNTAIGATTPSTGAFTTMTFTSNLPVTNLNSGTAASSSTFWRGDGTWAVPSGGGGSSDMLSTLTSAEISITGATTGTISRMHVCTGTTADYAVTLPAASGNTGKFIGFRMGPALTKLVTLDGNSSELIDGTTTRIMHSNEVAILLCDGTAWTKVAGKTLPIEISARDSGSDQSIGTNTSVTLDLSVSISDPYGNVNLGTDTLTIPRPGIWSVDFRPSLYDFSASTAEVDGAITLNGTGNFARDRRYVGFVGSGTATQCYPALNISFTLAAGDTIVPTMYVGNVTAKTLAGLSVYSVITLREVSSW